MSKEIKNINDLIEVVKTIDPMSIRDIQLCLVQIADIVNHVSTKVSKNVEVAIQEKDFELGHALLDTVQEIGVFQNKLDKQIETLEVSMGEFNDFDEDLEVDVEQIPQFDDDISTFLTGIASQEVLEENSACYYMTNSEGHYLTENFAHTKPMAFSLLGTKVAAKSWKDVFFKTCDILVERNYGKISTLAKEDKLRGSKVVYISTKPKDMRKPEKLTNHEIYVETALDANFVRDLVIKLLNLCSIPTNDYRIYLKPKYKTEE